MQPHRSMRTFGAFCALGTLVWLVGCGTESGQGETSSDGGNSPAVGESGGQQEEQTAGSTGANEIGGGGGSGTGDGFGGEPADGGTSSGGTGTGGDFGSGGSGGGGTGGTLAGGGTGGECPAGYRDCGESCIDVTGDPNNCGDCGFVCPGGTFCSSGLCEGPASGGSGTGGYATAGSAGVAGAPSGGSGAGGSGVGGTSSGGAGAGGVGTGGQDGTGGAGGESAAACDGYTLPLGTLCRSNADCQPMEYCLAPGETAVTCGACTMPPMECYVDGDCAAGTVCLTYAITCSCGGLAQGCAPACTADSCPAAERCNSRGHCEPIPCDDGFECPESTRCAPAADVVDAHGCEPLPCYEGLFECPANNLCGNTSRDHGCYAMPCEIDLDCDCGACVEGRCAARPGTCEYMPM